MASNPTNNDDLIAVGALIVGVMCLILSWSFFHAEISYHALKLTWHLLGFIDVGGIFGFVSDWRQELVDLTAYSADMSLLNLLLVINKTGYLFVALPFAFTVYMLWRTSKHKAFKTKRFIDTDSLPHIMADHASAVIPVLHYGDLLNTDVYEQRSALSLDEWIKEHKLIVNGRLDNDQTLKALNTQLGSPLASLNEMRPHEKVLCSIFLARITAEDGYAKSNAMLDRINQSCHTGAYEGNRGYPDFTLIEDIYEDFSQNEVLHTMFKIHPYSRTLLSRLHSMALTKGKLPSSSFRWLKGMDRGLWYVLNSTGRKTPFIESLAPYTQRQWEEYAHKHGYTLSSAHLEDAVVAIKQAYEHQKR